MNSRHSKVGLSASKQEKYTFWYFSIITQCCNNVFKSYAPSEWPWSKRTSVRHTRDTTGPVFTNTSYAIGLFLKEISANPDAGHIISEIICPSQRSLTNVKLCEFELCYTNFRVRSKRMSAADIGQMAEMSAVHAHSYASADVKSRVSGKCDYSLRFPEEINRVIRLATSTYTICRCAVNCETISSNAIFFCLCKVAMFLPASIRVL